MDAQRRLGVFEDMQEGWSRWGQRRPAVSRCARLLTTPSSTLARRLLTILWAQLWADRLRGPLWAVGDRRGVSACMLTRPEGISATVAACVPARASHWRALLGAVGDEGAPAAKGPESLPHILDFAAIVKAGWRAPLAHEMSVSAECGCAALECLSSVHLCSAAEPSR